MDLFGKQARQEQERLREKLNGLELRYCDIVARHSAISEELRESKVFITTINSSNKLKAQYEDEKRDHYQKAAEYTRKSKEIDSKEAEILAAHEKKKATLTKEMRELEGKVSVIKAELADSQKRAKALEKEIQTAENKRDSVVAEVEKLKAGRLNAEAAVSKAQEKQSELSGAVDKLTRQQEALATSHLYLNQVVSRLNRQGDDDTVFASLEHDLHRFLINDRTSGAMQVTLEARPLLLVVDLGYDSLNFAVVRAGLVSGGSEISLCLESRKIERGMGCSRFEALLAGWVWERFSAVHPRLKKSVKAQKGIEFSLPVSQRLLALLCQGAPQGEVEETIVIDSEPFSASIPLLREELVSVFLPLLGPDGELTGAIRRFLAEFKLSVDAIDRVVCMGWYGRLPLLRESLGEVFKRPVLVAELVGTVGVVEARVMTESLQKSEILRSGTVSVIVSDTEREKREKAETERQVREEIEKVEQEREKASLIYIDRSTGLQWAKHANIAWERMNWENVKRWASNLEYGGYRDWRLPTKEELESFAKKGGSRPAEYFNANGFNNVQACDYWSSSTYASSTDCVWCVGMNDGNVYYNYHAGSRYVWPVRSGQY